MENHRKDSQKSSRKNKSIFKIFKKIKYKLLGINEEELAELERIKAIPSKPYYNYSIEEISKELDTDIEKGLKKEDVSGKLEEFGYNELPKIRKSIWKVYFAPIFNFLIVILIVAGTIILILGYSGYTIYIIWGVIVVNSLTAVIQQYRAQKALESLKKISALKSTVIRDGSQIELETRELVPGDIMVLNQGDKVPADGRLVKSVNLSINEAPLTGESVSIEKSEDIIETQEIPLQKQLNMTFMGTYISTGRGHAIITGTGIRTEIGRISQTLNEMGSIEDIPLTRKMNNFAKWLVILVFINLSILIIYKLLTMEIYTPESINEQIVAAIFRSMNVIPINLPLLATLVMLTGVLNLAKSGVIIRNLSAIESMGRVSVICTDKTGTITKNEMTVQKFWFDDKVFEVTGVGYDNEGDIKINGTKIKFREKNHFDLFIKSMVLNNTSSIIKEDVKVKAKKLVTKTIRRALGSPTEAALLVLAEKAGFNIEKLRDEFIPIQEFSFDSSVKRMSTIYKIKGVNNHETFAFVKGASEIIVNRCNQISLNKNIISFSSEKKLEILDLIKKYAESGYRTLSIAYKMINGTLNQDKKFNRDDVETELIFLGFVVILDPPREGVPQAVENCKLAGIDVVMITGDHPATAEAIAKNIDLFDEGDIVVEGKNIENLSKEEFNRVSVFARVIPSDKEKIIKNYQNQNRIVAMTGDGINDSLALKLANTGIAMGITGTDVAKEVSDMVISDDNFVSIEKGVRIGRGIFSRIRVIIFFFICINIMEAIFFFTAEFLPIPGFKLFNDWQHTYIFAIVHSFPALALVVDTIPKDIMREPPRNEEEILSKRMIYLLIIQSVLMGMGLALSYYLTFYGLIPLNDFNLDPNLSYIVPKELLGSNQFVFPISEAHQKARTMCMTVLFLSETTFIWSIRRPNNSIKQSFINEFDKNLMGMNMFCIIIHVLLIIFSYPVNYAINDVLGLNFHFDYMFLSPTDWIWVFILVAQSVIGVELFKYIARKRKIFF
jgi:Ca2+-transporting ATPase